MISDPLSMFAPSILKPLPSIGPGRNRSRRHRRMKTSGLTQRRSPKRKAGR